RAVAQEREMTASLEHAVQKRTSELDDAQRVLQRMWWLGQQITLELDSQRVIDRFLEAVVDIAHADSSVIGLLQEDGQIKFVVGTGVARHVIGTTIPVSGSAMGRVIRSGVAWTVSDVSAHKDEFDQELFARMKDRVASLAIVPISRRGDRIGAVALATTER